MSGTGLWGRMIAASSFLRARSLARRLRTRADIEAWQAKRLERFVLKIAPRVPAYRDVNAKTLTDLPFMDKAQLMANFHLYNRAGVTAVEARAALAGSGRIGRYSVGASTGTSGNRGLYLVSDHERFTWLGVMLAKALPDVTKVRHRVAIVLPASSRLYDSANESGRLSLSFFDLHRGVDVILPEVAAFAPTVIVAPPKVLREMAQADLTLAPKKLYSAAEVLDPLDRAVIEARFGVTLGQIYMATEGLFGVSCDKGGLHLAEDFVAFEWDRPADADGLVAPLITDFTRSTQVMARYRMNDLLRLQAGHCDCGSPLQLVDEVVGRMDDVFRLPRRDGQGDRLVTPDLIRNAIVRADSRISDFRVVQSGVRDVALRLPSERVAELPAAQAALGRLFDGLGLDVALTAEATPLPAPDGRKLRRVMRENGKPA